MYECKMRVGLEDVSPQCSMRFDAMLRFMTNCATYQTQDHVYDICEMAKSRRGWFVVSWQVRIDEFPRLCDEIVVQTYPYKFSGFLGLRHFKILSADGRELFRANSIWTWMDLDTGKPLRVPMEYQSSFGCDAPPEEEWPGRKIGLPEGLKSAFDFSVNPMLLDTNGHMNNSYYVQAAEKCLPEDFLPKAFFVEYKKQAMPGALVTVGSRVIGDEAFCALCDEEGDAYAAVRFER